jgi:hypothetical protein
MSKLLMYEAELQDVKNEMDQLTQSGVGKEDERYKAKETREAELLQLVMEEEQLLTKTQGIIANAQDPDSSFGISVQGMTVNFREVTDKEESYQALAIAYQLKLQEIEDTNQAEVKAIQSSFNAELAQRDQVEQSLRENLHQTGLERDDFESKWLAATSDRNELLADNTLLSGENASLKAQVEELRNQVSKPTTTTNLDNGALAQAMERLKASRPAIYNVVEVSGTKSTAVLVDTNETIEFHPNYIGKYRVVSYEDAMQIRNEIDQAKQDDASLVPDSESVEAVEEFRPESGVPIPDLQNVDSGHIVDEYSTTGQDGQDVAGGVVTREEFEALKKDVEKLKYHVGFGEINQGAAA